MSRFITVPNRDHPAHRLKQLVTQLKHIYQAQSTEKLRGILQREAPAVAEAGTLQYRHEIVRYLLDAAVVEFKLAWQKANGWPFDDIYDPEKYRAHLEQARRNHVPQDETPVIHAAAGGS